MPDRSSSNPTVPGRTARQNASTARYKPNGPTGRSSPATTNGPQPLHPGSRTTTLDAVTAHSVASHRSADCNQPDVSVHLSGHAYCSGDISCSIVGISSQTVG